MTFSGFTYRELTAAGIPDGAAELLCATDLLVSGPYLADRPDIGRPWVVRPIRSFTSSPIACGTWRQS